MLIAREVIGTNNYKQTITSQQKISKTDDDGDDNNNNNSNNKSKIGAKMIFIYLTF